MRLLPTVSRFLPAALLVGSLWAQSEPLPLVRAEVDYASRYVFRGVERSGQATQATVEFSRDNFRGGLWANLPFESGAQRELNLGAAYSWQALDGLTLEGSAKQYWFSNVPSGGTRQSFEAGMIATLAAIGGFTPSVGYFHDFRLRSDTVQAALAHSIALTRWGAFLDLEFFAGWATSHDWRPADSGPPARDRYGYWGAQAHLPYRIGPHSTVITGVQYTHAEGLSPTNGPFNFGSRENLWFTLGLSLDF